MTELFEATFHGAQENELFFQHWKVMEPRATVVITHGLSEHSECYTGLAERLNKSQYDVVAWDMRGHGRSEGKRGYVEDFKDFEYDLFRLIQVLKNEESVTNKKLILFGHSLGGLVTVMSYLQYKFTEVEGLVLSAPAMGLSIDVPAWKKKFAVFGSKWLPKLTLWNEVLYEDLSRDEDVIKSYKSDPLRHDKISPGIFLGMLNGFQVVEEKEKDINLPVLIQLAGADNIVNSSSTIRFYENLSSQTKTLHIYEDSLHEIYNDLDREIVIKDLLKFLNELDKRTKNES